MTIITHRTRGLLSAVALVALLSLAGGASRARLPEPDFTFFGTAKVDGQLLFAGTISVEPKLGADCSTPLGMPLVSFTVPVNPAPNYVYALRVPIDSLEPQAPGTARPGDPVCFFINGVSAGEDVVGNQPVIGETRGLVKLLNLDTANGPGGPALSIADVELFEGNAGATFVEFTVTLDPVATEDVIFTFATADNTADFQDYTVVPDTPPVEFTIPAGASSATIGTDVLGDITVEPDETFFVRLVDVDGADIADGEARCTILDDDAPPTVTVSDPTVTEGATATAEFTISLSRPATLDEPINFVTTDGSATSGLDYVFSSGTATILSGATSTVVTVDLLADSIDEQDETFTLDVQSPLLGTASGTATILDDERFLQWVEAEVDGIDSVSGLDAAVSSTLSPEPDPKHLYVAGLADNAIAIFQRDRAADPAPGELTYLGTIADELGAGFVSGLQGVSETAISPDGNFLYASAAVSQAISVFDRNRITGELVFVQEIVDGVNSVDGLTGAAGLAISPDPDGNHVYVVGAADNALARFDRDDPTGTLTYAGVIRDNAVEVGSGRTINGLAGATDVVISPDGTLLFVAGELDNAVAIFDRDAPTGALFFRDAVKQGVSGVTGLAAPSALALSPDAAHLYVTGRSGNTIAGFRWDPIAGTAGTGGLVPIQVLENGAADVRGLEAASSVAVGDDGRFVYATGFDDDAVTVFRRNLTSGLLEFIEARENSESDVNGIARPTSVIVSPTNREVYVTGSQDDAIALFVREFVAPTNPTAFDSTSHVANTPLNDPALVLQWSGAVDNLDGSGVDGYSIVIDGNSATLPDATVDVIHGVDPQQGSYTQADGSWYAHLRTCDRSDNCTPDALHIGPFLIDTVPPVAPVGLIAVANSNVLEASWTPVPDSGLAGYAVSVDANAATSCNGVLNVLAPTSAFSSAPLANGYYYAHVCAIDTAGNVGPTSHFGPVLVEVCTDLDGDGFGDPAVASCPGGLDVDCDDTDDQVYPGRVWHEDLDADGFGNPAVQQISCPQPAGFVADDSDCDDSLPDGDQVNPNAVESCSNGIDDDCNGDVDDDDCACGSNTRTIAPGWSFVGPRRVSVPPLTAAAVCDAIEPSALEIDRYDGAAWVDHACGSGVDFPVDTGEGYFLRADAEVTWCETGDPVPTPLNLTLVDDWNSISLPESIVASDAAAVCADLSADLADPIEIDRWVDGGWLSHRCGLPFHNFPIEPGEGYFVLAATPATWTPQLAPVEPFVTVDAGTDGVVDLDRAGHEFGDTSQSDAGDRRTTLTPRARFSLLQRERLRRGPSWALGTDSGTRVSGEGSPDDQSIVDLQRGDEALNSPEGIPGSELCPIRVANVRDAGFTLVWATEPSGTGHVEYGPTGGALNEAACDVRDASATCTGLFETHVVEIAGLAPATTYDVQPYTDGGAAGPVIQVTTAPVLGIPASDTAYGQGELTGGGDAVGGYVCASVQDADAGGSPGSSTLECDLIEAGDDGYWAVNLGNLRTADLSAPFDYSASGDDLVLEACAAAAGCVDAAIDTAADDPATTLALIVACDCVATASDDTTCDGVDDDCDGAFDEDYAENSTCGVGECAGTTEPLSCVAGVPVDTCDPFAAAVPEVCGDGLDNDCDGEADEDCGAAIFSTTSTHSAAGTLVFPHIPQTVESNVAPIVAYSSAFLTSGIGLDALSELPDGDLVFSTTGNGSYLGVSYDWRVLYRYDLATATVSSYFSPATIGVTANFDAVSVGAGGEIAFSTVSNRNVSFNGGPIMSLKRESVYLYDPAGPSLTLLLDGTALGLGQVDAVDVLTSGRVVFSTQGDVTVGGQTLLHKNGYECDPTACVPTLYFDAAAHGVLNLDALSMD